MLTSPLHLPTTLFKRSYALLVKSDMLGILGQVKVSLKNNFLFYQKYKIVKQKFILEGKVVKKRKKKDSNDKDGKDEEEEEEENEDGEVTEFRDATEKQTTDASQSDACPPINVTESDSSSKDIEKAGSSKEKEIKSNCSNSLDSSELSISPKSTDWLAVLEGTINHLIATLNKNV